MYSVPPCSSLAGMVVSRVLLKLVCRLKGNRAHPTMEKSSTVVSRYFMFMYFSCIKVGIIFYKQISGQRA